MDAHRSVADTFASQADGFYRAVSNVLKSRNMVPGDFVRSWNYVDSILMRYSEFNAVRDARFAELGVVGPEYPAGTGIDCVLEGSSKMRAFAEFHSRGMK